MPLLSRLHVLLTGDGKSAEAALASVDAGIARTQANVGSLNTRGFGALDAQIAELKRSIRGLNGNSAADGIDRLKDSLAGLPSLTRVELDVTDVTDKAREVTRLSRAVGRLRAAATSPLNIDVRSSLGMPIAELQEVSDSLDKAGRSAVRLKAHSPIKIVLQNGVTAADIFQLRALADQLDRIRDVRASVNVRGVTEAQARVALLERQLSGIRGEHRARVAVSVLGANALKSITGSVSGLGKVAVAGTAIGAGLLTAVSAGNSLIAVLTGISGGAIAGSLGAVGAGAVGIAAGFTAATAGVLAWGALAYPTISRVTTAFTEYTKAQEDGRKALAVGDTKGVTKALEDQAKALALLSPEQRTVVGELSTLRDTWFDTARVLERPTLSIFSTGLRTLSDLLPRLVPLAAGVGGALQDVALRMEAGFKGNTFGRFLATLEAESPRAVSQFGEIGGNLAGALMNGLVIGVPVMQVVMAGLVSSTERLEQAAGGEKFASFLSYGIEMMGPFNRAVGSLTGALVSLLVGLAPLGTTGLGALERLGDGLNRAFSGPGMAAFRDSVVTLMPLAGDALGELGRAFGAFLDVLRPLTPVALQFLGGIGTLLAEAFRSDAAVSFVASLSALLPTLLPILSTLVNTAISVGDAFLTALVPVLPQLQGPIAEVGGSLVELATAVTPLLGYLPQAAQVMVQLADGAVVLVGWLVQLAEFALPMVLDGLQWLTQNPEVTAALLGIGAAVALLVQGFMAVLPLLGPFIPALGGLVAAAAPVVGVIALIITGLVAWGIAIYELVKNWDDFVWAFQNPLAVWREMWATAFRAVINIVKALPDGIRSAFLGAGTMLFGSGQDLIFGLLGGIGSMLSAPVTMMRNLARSMFGAFTDEFDIHSPSRKMLWAGSMAGKGATLGVEGEAAAFQNAWSRYTVPSLNVPTATGATASVSGSTLAAVPAQRTVSGGAGGDIYVTINSNSAEEIWAQLEPLMEEREDRAVTRLRQSRGGR